MFFSSSLFLSSPFHHLLESPITLLFCLGFASAIPFLFVFSKVILDENTDLLWEGGRRKAFLKFRRDSDYYVSKGVKSCENYVTFSRGIELFTRQWLPLSGNFKAIVFYCHGYGDSSSFLFDDVAVRLCQSNYVVISFDYCGHGRSQGLHGFIPEFDLLIDDAIEYAEMIKSKSEFQNLPLFLYGESMGGAVAIKAHLKQPQLWNGAILSAPMCKISKDMLPPPHIIETLKFLAKFFPKWKAVPGRDLCHFSFRCVEKRQLAYKNPTSFKGKPRLGTALQLLLTTQEIGSQLSEVSLPLLILHGASDVVTDPSVSKALYSQSKSMDKTIRIYEDSWHALVAGEPDDVVEVIMSDILSWLDVRSKRFAEDDAQLDCEESGVKGHGVSKQEDARPLDFLPMNL